MLHQNPVSSLSSVSSLPIEQSEDKKEEQKIPEQQALRLAELAEVAQAFQIEEKDPAIAIADDQRDIQILNQEIHGRLQALQELKEEKEITAKANELRTTLETALSRREIAANRPLGDSIYNLQRILTRYWPRNELDEHGAPLDTILADDSIIPPADRIESASGYIYSRTSLQRYFNEPTSLQRIKKVGFAVMNLPPSPNVLPPVGNSCYVLVQEVPGAPPSSLWFVDRSRDLPEVQEIAFPLNRTPLSFARSLFPNTLHHRYYNIQQLSLVQRSNIIRHIGAEQLIKYRTPEGFWFGSRDIEHFRARHHLNIPQLNLALHNRQIQEEGWLALSSMGVLDRIPFLNNINSLVSRLRNRFNRHRGLITGLLLGLLGGMVAAFVATLVLIHPLFAALAGPHVLAAFGVGVIGGLVHRHRGNRFWRGFIAATAASLLILGLAAYLVPIALPALGIVSAATLAASSIWAYVVLPAIPLVVAAVAGICEHFRPGSMQRFYTGVLRFTFGLPAALGGAIGAALGGLGGFLGRDLPHIIRDRLRSPLARPEGLMDPLPEAQQPDGRRLSPNAQAHQAFANQQAPESRQEHELAPRPHQEPGLAKDPCRQRIARLFKIDPDRLVAVNPKERAIVADGPVNSCRA